MLPLRQRPKTDRSNVGCPGFEIGGVRLTVTLAFDPAASAANEVDALLAEPGLLQGVDDDIASAGPAKRTRAKSRRSGSVSSTGYIG
jgi:hypothetical protein